ncbi:neprosin family prolyl endopeptidase [Actinoplanes sp. NPDC049265]|uniref:neprosin family prolyl endopeptidase n=1 Tax=Actinoplanes sp. NPDC049265 TaxID=3363902 RepID=UPI0037227FBD
MNAAAEEAPAAAQPAPAVADDAPKPPPLLPWGDKPEAVKRGTPGATSAQLAATGADIAPASTKPSAVPTPEYGPKGFTGKKRWLRKGRTAVPPKPPQVGGGPLRAPEPGTRDVNYHYATGYQYAVADGTSANLVIGKPYLAAEDYHTLAEVAVEDADGQQIIEVGWTVSRNVNGDEDPHLFVYHWVDGVGTCYNGCGWKQVSTDVVPGDTLPTGVYKKFGIQQFDSVWWVAYDSEWIGYFPNGLWRGKFQKSGLIQWYGEVASSKVAPCTDMGNGTDASKDSAARFSSISLVNNPDLKVTLESKSPEMPPGKGIYPTVFAKERAFYFGGAGAC